MRPLVSCRWQLSRSLLAAGCGSEAADGPDRPLTLVLDFTPNGAHAGVYAAVEKRRDRAHGVRLRVRQPTASSDSLKLLSAGRADLAVADIHDLGLARERGERPRGRRRARAAPARGRDRRARGEAAARPRGPARGRDRACRRTRRCCARSCAATAATRKPCARITIGFSAVPSLIARKVSAATAFWNVEGVTLRRRGVRTREFRVDAYGAPRYPELVLVARRETLERDRGPAARRRSAALRGRRAIAAAHAGAGAAPRWRARPGSGRRQSARSSTRCGRRWSAGAAEPHGAGGVGGVRRALRNPARGLM